MAENDHKMADSGLSSMETTPDIEDIDTDSRTVTLTRTLTEKRKHYVCRMSSTIDYENVTKKLTDKTNLNSCYSTLKKRSAKHKVPNAKEESIEKLFDMCLLVGYNSLTSHGYVKTVFPAEITPPEHIENLIFPEFQFSSTSVKPKNSSAKKINQTSLKPNEDNPEANKTSPNLSRSRNFKKHLKSNIHDEQNYSLILTDENGIRKFGYCRKIKPENSEICLPLVYCIVTKTRAPGFYFKVLKELETRHGQSDYQSRNILNQLYNAKIPKTGQHLHVKIPNSPRPKSAAIPSHYLNVSELKRLSLAYETTMPTSKSHNDLKSNELNNDLIEIGKVENQIEQFEMLGGDDRFEIINRRLLNQNCNRSFTEIVISRPYDCRLENNEMTILFDCLNVETFLNVFGSLLIERKVILVGTSMSKICSCIEGLQSILYPFVWQHTLVSILPSNLVEITSAPIPIIAGILENGEEEITVDEGVLVNIDSSTILASEGDEPTLIPSSLSSSLKLSLSLVKTTTVNTDPTRNVLISEAFIKFFIAAIGTYVTGFEHGEFQKEALINSHPCKTTRFFLEWFTETAMFKHFIHEKLKMIQISNQSDEIASQNELKAENTVENVAIKTKNIDLTSNKEQTQENSNIRKNTQSNNCSLENGNNSKTKDEINHLSDYYKIFDSKIFEVRPNDNCGKKTTELFLKNHRALNRKGKTIGEKFKEFMNS